MWKQSRARKRKLKKLAKETENNVSAGAYWRSDRGCYYRYSIGDNAKSRRHFIKQQCNRKFRRASKNLEISSKCIHHKMTEFWREID